MKENIHKRIQSDRIYDKDTVENRYNVKITYDFSREIVKKCKMSKIGVVTCKLSYKVEIYGDLILRERFHEAEEAFVKRSQFLTNFFVSEVTTKVAKSVVQNQFWDRKTAQFSKTIRGHFDKV